MNLSDVGKDVFVLVEPSHLIMIYAHDIISDTFDPFTSPIKSHQEQPL